MPSKIKPTAFRVRPPLKAKLVEAAKTRASVHATALEAMEMGLDLMLGGKPYVHPTNDPVAAVAVMKAALDQPGHVSPAKPQKARRESASVAAPNRLDKAAIGKRLDGGKKAVKGN